MEDLKFQINLSSLDKSSLLQLDVIFKKIEEKLAIDGLALVMNMLCVEIINYIFFAGMRQDFIVKNGYDLEVEESYKKGLIAFEKRYPPEKGKEIQNYLEALKVMVEIALDLDQRRLLIKIKNRAKLLPNEEKELRKRLALAMSEDNITKFVETLNVSVPGKSERLEQGKNKERDNQFTLALRNIISSIRSIGFDAKHFRVYKEKNTSFTITRWELPLHEDYIPIRDRQN